MENIRISMKRLDYSLVDSSDGIVVLSSGRYLPPEGDIYINEAISKGIPKENLFTTYPVTNTLQEAKAIKKLLVNEILSSKKKIILVTSAFHMKRAKKVFEREGISVQPYPVDFKSSKSFFLHHVIH